MNTLSVSVCYRPLKIGWAVCKDDLEGFRKIVHLNTILWGGQYNPILVVDQDRQAEQLVDVFRVDLIVRASDSELVSTFIDRFPHLRSPFIFQKVIVNDGNHGSFSNALDIHNALVYLRDRPEWKVMKDRGFREIRWQESDPLADALLAQFGDYPSADETGIRFREFAIQESDATDYTIHANVPLPGDLYGGQSIKALSKYALKRHYSIRQDSRIPGYFIGDSSSFDDLVCFWNLRAADIPLFFVDPSFDSRYQLAVPAWAEYSQEHLSGHFPDEAPRMSLWSREAISQKSQEIFGDQQFWHYRVSEHMWGGNNVCPPMMYFSETKALGVLTKEFGQPSVSFPLSEKPFAGDNWFHTQRLVASIAFLGGLYGDDEHTLQPPYVPELNTFLGRQMGPGPSDLRVEYERVGLFIGASDYNAKLRALPADALIEEVLKLGGFGSKPSSAGLITRQLIIRLGGMQGARPFKIPGVRRLIRAYGPSKSFSKGCALQLIGGPDPENSGATFEDHNYLVIERRDPGQSLRPHDVFRFLVEKSLFRIGFDLTCPACRMDSWVSVDDLNQKHKCDLCGSEFDATSQLLTEKWRYRRSGVLGREKNAQGAVPVALTLQQLETTLSSFEECIYSTSQELEPVNDENLPKCEVDFIWLIPPRHPHKTKIIFGECKDRGDIDEIDFATDVEHLRKVADSMPPNRFESYVLISKLAEFTSKEKELAKSLNDKHRNRVILLTDRELEPYFIFERTKKRYEVDEYARSPDELAAATTKMYFSEPGTGSAVLFDGDDKGYLAWIRQNPRGYVVNIRRRHNPKYAVLHRASCTLVARYRNMRKLPGGFTERGHRKICGATTVVVKLFLSNFSEGPCSISSACPSCAPRRSRRERRA